MPNLFYTTVAGGEFNALVVVDKDGTLFYTSLAGRSNTSDHGLMMRDFSRHKDYRLNALSSTTLVKNRDHIDKTISLVKEALEDPASVDLSKIKHKIIFGTSLQRKVWNKLLEIESGTVTDYYTLAAELEMPSSSRVVGNCVGANKLALFIPCHRVLTRTRKISGYRYGVEIKKSILKLELGNQYDKLVK